MKRGRVTTDITLCGASKGKRLQNYSRTRRTNDRFSIRSQSGRLIKLNRRRFVSLIEIQN